MTSTQDHPSTSTEDSNNSPSPHPKKARHHEQCKVTSGSPTSTEAIPKDSSIRPTPKKSKQVASNSKPRSKHPAKKPRRPSVAYELQNGM